ncbi:hypothetical protein A3Q56_06473 [Intoshia linei]|uniref:BHLH domain-containing protein n=1 Tax=Intoshia linei TaxID=1819745 RepID=A0A177AUW9_9BILA|nr:hypothetical protein A3Q56_06473 [Intoshia linei]
MVNKKNRKKFISATKLSKSPPISPNSKDDASQYDERRAHHNALERKRRDHIKDSFVSLRKSVPSLSRDKVSRAQVLIHATSYIKYLTKKINANKRESDILELENRETYQKVKKMECRLNRLDMSDGDNSDDGIFGIDNLLQEFNVKFE